MIFLGVMAVLIRGTISATSALRLIRRV
jgi:hypothetical protein